MAATAVLVIMVAGIVAVLLAPQMPLLTGLPALAMAAVTPLVIQSRPAGRHFKMTSILGPVATTAVPTLAVLVVTLGAAGSSPARWWMLFTVVAVGVGMTVMQSPAARRDTAEATR